MMTKLFAQAAVLAALFCLEGLFPLFEGRTARLRHGLRNLGHGVLNGLIALAFSAATIGVLEWSQNRGFGLLNVWSLPSAVDWAAGFLLFDAWMYAWHRANHNAPFLWRFHRMHHSDLELDCTSALRFHPGEIILSHLARLAVLPLLGLEFPQLLVYEIALQPVILFHHSNVALPERWDRMLRALIVTPNMHRVHHSQAAFETNSNYSSIFSFWDRLARTFRKINHVSALRYGLPYFREDQWQRFPGMLKTPFVEPVVPPQ